jgi:hypothetical protein
MMISLWLPARSTVPPSALIVIHKEIGEWDHDLADPDQWHDLSSLVAA